MSKVCARIGVSRIAVAVFVFLLSSFVTSVGQSANSDAQRPLRGSEVMAIQVGGALAANIAHDVASRGLNFHPDEAFLALMTKAGADAGVIAALKAAKVSDPVIAPDMELIKKLSDAAVLMKNRQL